VSPEAVAFASTVHALTNAVVNVLVVGGIAGAVALIAPNLPSILRAMKGL
jgi:hypothetical protein